MLVSEAAAQLGMTPSAVRQAIDREEIQGQKVGGVWKVLRADVDRYVKSPGGKGKPRASKPGPRGPLTEEQRANATTAQRARRDRERPAK